eukprot:COSAG03_NODE_5055_length_1351_cov_10.427316_1_plen_222_part_00
MCVCEGQREKQRVTCVAVAGEAQDLRAHRRVQHATCGAAGGSRRRKRRKRRLARAAAQVVPNATQTLAVPLLLPPLQRHLLASHGGGGAPALSACRRPCQWSGGPPRRKQSRAARATHSGPLARHIHSTARPPRRPLRLEVPFFLLRIADMGCLHWLKRPFNGLGPRKSPSFQSAECPEWFPEWFPMKSNPNESNDYCSKISCAYLIGPCTTANSAAGRNT